MPDSPSAHRQLARVFDLSAFQADPEVTARVAENTRAWLADEPRRKAAEEAARVASRTAALERLGVPGRHAALVAAGKLERRGPLLQAEQWHATGAQGLVLAGDTGRGKSVAAAWLADRGPRRRPGPVVWVHASDLGRLSLFDRGPEPEPAAPRRRPRFSWDDLLDAQLVILDDLSFAWLCREETVRERACVFLAQAFDNGAEVVMTANMGRAQIEEMLGAAQILDRLDAWCDWRESGGESCRRKETGRT